MIVSAAIINWEFGSWNKQVHGVVWSGSYHADDERVCRIISELNDSVPVSLYPTSGQPGFMLLMNSGLCVNVSLREVNEFLK